MIPEELKEYAQWVCWKLIGRDAKRIKLPITPRTGKGARANDPLTWTTYEEATNRAWQYDGIGFFFSEYDEFVGIDIDHCIGPDGALSDLARDLIEKSGSYAEISQSGTGVHILVKGKLSKPGFRTKSLEVYQANRYFAMTGNAIGAPDIKYAQNLLDEIEETIWKEREEKERKRQENGSRRVLTTKVRHLDDETLLTKLFQQKNGSVIKLLYEGMDAKYGNTSEDDLYFCWCVNARNGNDLDQTDRIFRSSGRMRKKWDERHYANGDTYGYQTLLKSRAK